MLNPWVYFNQGLINFHSLQGWGNEIWRESGFKKLYYYESLLNINNFSKANPANKPFALAILTNKIPAFSGNEYDQIL